MKKATRKLLLLALSILTLMAVFTSCQIPDNKAGADGKSAYELAVEQGFNGTVEEWLTSLIGAKGDDGVGIEKVEIDYKGAIVITMTNGERYELWAEKFCTHSDMESTSSDIGVVSILGIVNFTACSKIEPYSFVFSPFNSNHCNNITR